MLAVGIFSGVASASGTSSVLATGRSTAASLASSSGVGDGSFAGAFIKGVTASASGTSSVAAVGIAYFASTGSAAGASSVAATGISTAASTALASGTGASGVIGGSTISAVAGASAQGSPLAGGSSIGAGTAVAAGTGSVAGLGSLLRWAVAAASGTGSLAFVTEPPPGSVANATSTSSASAASGYLYNLHPNRDVFPGTWTTETGSSGNLYLSVDEDVADDMDYIRSVDDPVAASTELGFEDPSLAIGDEIYVEYRYGKGGTTPVDIRVNLKCEGNVIATWFHSNVSTTMTTVSQILSPSQISDITDPTALTVEIIANP